MTAWLDNLAGLAEAQLDAFGEPITPPPDVLPADGAETFIGIFDPIGQAPTLPWSEVGLGMRLSDQPSPTVILRSADAALLVEQCRLTIRATGYLVTQIHPSDDTGLSRVELMPDTSVTPESARWR